jgi:AAHS family benzoate transporter-like MFS transporter
MGWASGIGRIGAIVGPVLTGALLTLELPHQMNFLVIAIPGVIAAIAIFLVNLKASVEKNTVLSATSPQQNIVGNTTN